jgi:hypothetical protein
MTDVIHLHEKRDAKRSREQSPKLGIYYCECGSAMFRLYDDGGVECLNCGGLANGLKVSERE